MKKESTNVARKLRKELTEAEKYLWNILRCRNLGVKFRRQAAIGRYIVDFVCFKRRLVVEVDGGQHAEEQRDRARDEWLKKEGFYVLRFWNHEVLGNGEGVIERIMAHLIPLPDPPHKGEGINVNEKF